RLASVRRHWRRAARLGEETQALGAEARRLVDRRSLRLPLERFVDLVERALYVTERRGVGRDELRRAAQETSLRREGARRDEAGGFALRIRGSTRRRSELFARDAQLLAEVFSFAVDLSARAGELARVLLGLGERGAGGGLVAGRACEARQDERVGVPGD